MFALLDLCHKNCRRSWFKACITHPIHSSFHSIVTRYRACTIKCLPIMNATWHASSHNRCTIAQCYERCFIQHMPHSLARGRASFKMSHTNTMHMPIQHLPKPNITKHALIIKHISAVSIIQPILAIPTYYRVRPILRNIYPNVIYKPCLFSRWYPTEFASLEYMPHPHAKRYASLNATEYVSFKSHQPLQHMAHFILQGMSDSVHSITTCCGAYLIECNSTYHIEYYSPCII